MTRAGELPSPGPCGLTWAGVLAQPAGVPEDSTDAALRFLLLSRERFPAVGQEFLQ